MQYLFHNTCSRKLKKAEQEYKRLCGIKEAMFNATQPRAKALNHDKVQISKSDNAIEHYIIKLDEMRLNEKISEALSIVNDRKLLVEMIEQDLRNSKDITERVYYFRYVRNGTIDWVSKMTGYSVRQVERILDKIKLALAR